MTGFLLKAGLLSLALLGTPLFVVIAAFALFSFHEADIDTSVVIIEMSRLADSPLLISLPLFIFAGVLLSESRTPERLLHLSRLTLGWLPGGLAIVSLLLCAVFTAFTGASGVTIFALGGLLLPTMLKGGYRERFTLGLLTSSGSLGLLFPPSLPLILYGVISGARIDHLFLAGIIPGLAMLVALIAYSVRKKHRLETGAPPSRGTDHQGKGRALRGALWELPLPVIILGGIYGGFLIVSEAAAVTALYVLLVEFFIHRDIPPRRLPALIVRAMILFGGILVVLAAAMAMTNYLVDQEVPARLFEWIRRFITGRMAFLLALNLFLLVVGCILDIYSAVVLVVPLIVPVATAFDVDLVHLGVIFLTNLQIGYCTPPVGLNLFLASYRFERPVTELYRATLPFLAILLGILVLITYAPFLSLFLVDLFAR